MSLCPRQVLSLPNAYRNFCVLFFGAECIIMLLANALIFLDVCADPSNLQKYKTVPMLHMCPRRPEVRQLSRT
jgi:hypothetical protein